MFGQAKIITGGHYQRTVFPAVAAVRDPFGLGEQPGRNGNDEDKQQYFFHTIILNKVFIRIYISC